MSFFDGAHWMHFVPRPRMPPGHELYARRWWALPAVSFGVFIIAVDITIVGIAAPNLATDLGATTTQIQWAFDAYTVTLAGFVLLGGGLAERFGRKGVMQLGNVVFAVGSAISAFAGSPEVLIAGRVVSGLGAAAVFPAALSIVGVLFPADERHRAFSIFASIACVGLALGPLIGGALLDTFWYGSAFLLAVPVALIGIAAVGAVVPPTRRAGSTSLDAAGAALSILGLGGIVFAVIEGPERGWVSADILVPLAIGALASAVFIWWELRTATPLFDLRVLRSEHVISGALAMGMVYFTFTGIQLLVPQYLRYVQDESSILAGTVMLPLGLVAVVLSPQSGALVDRFGQRAMLVTALSLMALGLATLAVLGVWGGVTNVVVALIIYSLGFGVVVAPATSAIMLAIPQEKASDGSAVNLLSRQFGGAIGVAVMGSVASGMYRAGLDLSGLALDPAQQDRVESSLSGALALGGELGTAAAERLDALADASMVHGLVGAMIVAAVISALAAALSSVLLRGSGSPLEAARAEAPDSSPPAETAV